MIILQSTSAARIRKRRHHILRLAIHFRDKHGEKETKVFTASVALQDYQRLTRRLATARVEIQKLSLTRHTARSDCIAKIQHFLTSEAFDAPSPLPPPLTVPSRSSHGGKEARPSQEATRILMCTLK